MHQLFRFFTFRLGHELETRSLRSTLNFQRRSFVACYNALRAVRDDVDYYSGEMLGIYYSCLRKVGISESSLKRHKAYIAAMAKMNKGFAVSDIEARAKILETVPLDVNRIFNQAPRVLLGIEPEKLQEKFYQMKSLGFSHPLIVRAFRRNPRILCYDLARVESRLELLTKEADLACGEAHVAFSHAPQIIGLHPDTISAKFQFLRDELGIVGQRLRLLLTRSPSFLTAGLDSRVLRNIRIYEGLGLDRRQIAQMAVRMPPILTVSKVDKIDAQFSLFRTWGWNDMEIGDVLCRYPALIGYSSEQRLLPCYNFLKDILGSDHDVSRLLLSYPSIVGFHLENNIKPKLQFVQQILEEDPGELLRIMPSYLTYSLERRVGPRVALYKHFHKGNPKISSLIAPKTTVFEKNVIPQSAGRDEIDSVVKNWRALLGFKDAIENKW